MARPFTLVAAIIFALIAMAHVYRVMTGFQLIVGTHTLAPAVSWAGMVIAAVLSFGLFREAMR